MEIKITDMRTDEILVGFSDKNYLSGSVYRLSDKVPVLSLSNDNLYSEAGYVISIPFKVLVEMAALVKMSGDSQELANDNLFNIEVKCFDKRKNMVTCEGHVIRMLQRKENKEYVSFIDLDTGFSILLVYTDKDIAKMENK